MKKVWEKPKLIVLIRGKPEESVLFFCKIVGYAEGPEGIFTNCGIISEQPPCSAFVSS